jgi:trigger factor
MNYTVQSINSCTKKLVFDIGSIDLTDRIRVALENKQKESNLKGFRKGKAPMDMINKLYGAEAQYEAINAFIQDEVYSAFEKEKIEVVGQPSFSNTKYEAEKKKISFEVVVEIFPQVKLKDFSGMKFTNELVMVTDDEVNNLKKSNMEGHAKMESRSEDTALEKGLFAVMNFEGVKENGERPKEMKGDGVLLEIGGQRFIPGFEEGMVGMKKGEKRELHLTFPADYRVEDLKNSKVTFHVEVTDVQQKKMPEWTDEVAKEWGFASCEDFMSKTRENLQHQKERQAKEKLHEQVLKTLVDNNNFDIPSSFIERQREHLQKDVTNALKQQGFTDSMVKEYFEKWAADLDAKASHQVRSGLILDKLAADFKIEATEADFEKKVEEMSKHTGMEPEKVRAYYKEHAEAKRHMLFGIREEKTFEKILEQVKVN